MSCEAVDRWLEAGGAAAGALPAAADEHARGCVRCAARLAAEREIVALLSAPPVAPAGFAEQVMQHVAAADRARAAASRPATPAVVPAARAALPLWVRVAADPAVVLAALVAAAFAWKASDLLALCVSLSQRLAVRFPSASVPTDHAFAAFSQPTVQLGLLTCLAVPMVWVSWMLYDSLRRLPLPPSLTIR